LRFFQLQQFFPRFRRAPAADKSGSGSEGRGLSGVTPLGRFLPRTDNLAKGAGRFKSKAAPFSPTPGFREAATVALDVIPTVDHHDEEANV